jgi:hypothetical protein
MSVYTYKGKVFTAIELTWLPILLPPVVLGIAAVFTEQDPPVSIFGWTLFFAVILGMWAIVGLYFLKKAKQQKNLRILIQPPGLVVGWDDDRYCVNGEAVNAVIVDCVIKMREAFPYAENALRGCVIWFREPTWIQGAPGYLARRVAGVQDGQLLVVGWHEDLTKTALMHELAHRILQVYDGDPPEPVAHQKMANLGVL